MTSLNLFLLPAPQELHESGGNLTLSGGGLIVLDASTPGELLFTAQKLQGVLKDVSGSRWEITAGSPRPLNNGQVVISVNPDDELHPQGYKLNIMEEHIQILASTVQGAFYGVQTLIQIIEQCGSELPTLTCRDWPDFEQRGVMLDISRDKVPTMEILYGLVDLFAGMKINQFQLYTEHTFAYRNHPKVWEYASPLTGEEILLLDQFCRTRFIELVPNQNTFGHMTRWLKHEEYLHLAEAPDGAQTPWGFFNPEPFSLSPVVPESFELVEELLSELLPHFSSKQVNVGCDETYDVGQGKSKDLAEKIGKERVYLDFVLKIYEVVKAHGLTMQFWGDIIMEYPELVPELPKDAVALEWGYEAEHPFNEHGAKFAASGIPFFVCPGTSSWNTVAGRTDNAIGNLRNAAENGLKHGAIGYLNTDWGDNGHWQPLPVSYVGFAAGAAFSWSYRANQGLDVPSVLNRFVFRDSAGVLGQLIYDLGNVHLQTEVPAPNGTSLFYALQYDPEKIVEALPDLEKAEESFRATLSAIDEILMPLAQAEMQHPDADLISLEVAWAADMLRHACWRVIWALGKHKGTEDLALRQHLWGDAQELIKVYRRIWHARNRPGGFVDSLARLEKMRNAYVV